MTAGLIRTRGLIFLIGLVCLALPAALISQQPSYDVLIRGGRVVDGSGNPWFRADVAIEGDRIVAVGQLGDVPAGRVIDATGLVVSPGFIDLHTHSDMPLLADGTAQSKVRQGVTLDVIGESSSVAPRDGLGTTSERGGQADWTTFSEYFERLQVQGISMNLISHVSATQVRRVVMGYDPRASTVDERQRMRELVARSMREGAWGLVTRFESGGPAHPVEIIEMARVVAAYGGNYTSHIGSEGYEQAAEIDFAIRVAEEAQIPVHLFHFKIRGRKNWGSIGQFIDQIQAARDRGVDVTANQYPYTAMFHPWSAFFPVWAREGGPARFAERLHDPAVRERIFRLRSSGAPSLARRTRTLTAPWSDSKPQLTSTPGSTLPPAARQPRQCASQPTSSHALGSAWGPCSISTSVMPPSASGLALGSSVSAISRHQGRRRAQAKSATRPRFASRAAQSAVATTPPTGSTQPRLS